MKRITNTTTAAITLLSKHVIPARGFADVSEAVAIRCANEAYTGNLVRKGALVIAEAQEAQPGVMTRDVVATMDLKTVKEYLTDLEAPTTGTLATLRERLAQIIFVDL